MPKTLYVKITAAALLVFTAISAPGPTGSCQENSPDEGFYIPAAERAAAIRSNVCSVCHGADGISKWSFVPNLAGQDRTYIVNQLQGLRGRRRADHYAQAAMWGHAANLKDDEIEAIADFYSNLEPSHGYSGRKATLELGKKIFERFEGDRPACAACHYEGRSNKDLPRLAGQHTDYESRTLHEFRAGFRVNGTMSYMASKLTDAEITAVATYVASFNSPKQLPPEVPANQAAGAPSVERGRALFQQFRCYQCHGEDGKGGISNPNAQGGKVPTLTMVSQGYSDAELKKKISTGVRYVDKDNPAGQTPPLFMPTWGTFLTDPQLDDLVAYLKSLANQGPKSTEW